MPRVWTKKEVELIINDYFVMLLSKLEGTPFNKTQHRKNLSQMLLNRSMGSIEFKHQNISAVMIDLGLPYISGYKPRSNYQGLLKEITAACLDSFPELIKAIEIDVNKCADLQNMNDILKVLVYPGDESVWAKGGGHYSKLNKALARPPPKRPNQRHKSSVTIRKKHPLIIGAKHHFEKQLYVHELGYLKPTKKLLVDLVVSKPCLDKALSFANELFLLLESKDYHVVIAPDSEQFRRADFENHEVPQNHDYQGLWSPWRCTTIYLGTVAIGLTIVEMSEEIKTIIKNLEQSTHKIACLVKEVECQAEIERKRWEAQQEKWRKEEEKRRKAEALKQSREGLFQIIHAWAKANQIEHFFKDAEQRVNDLSEDKKLKMFERLQRTRELIGNTDALDHFLKWKAPDEIK